MSQATPQELCAMLDAIAVGATDQLNKLIGRFASMRRVGDLLFVAGLDQPLPDVSMLINVALVDIDKYNQLSALCPGLLPPFSGNGLIELQRALNNAYLKLLANTDSHPFSKLAQLQARVNGMIGDAVIEFEARIGPGIQALNCARAICGATNQVGIYTPAVIRQTQDNYRNGIGLGGDNARVLTTEQQEAVDRLAQIRQNIINLLDDQTQQALSSNTETFQVENPSESSTQILLRGSPGTQGSQGLEGSQGFQGARGTAGTAGAQGRQGFQGLPSNVQGPQGNQGGLGNQGLQGVQGPQGFQGVMGGGSVNSVSVETTNGFAGTVANPTTDPAITIKTTVSGMLKGDGTSVSQAVLGVDYVTQPIVLKFVSLRG